MTTPTTQYAGLLACYRSGQVSERQWRQHLRDEVFAAYVERMEGVEAVSPGGCAPAVYVERSAR